MESLENILSKLNNTVGHSAWEHPLDKIFLEKDRAQYHFTNQLLSKFNEAFVNHDAKEIEDLCLIADADGLNDRYTLTFCDILLVDWHYMHEDIAMMLETIKDPRSISALYQRAIRIPSNDDGRSLAKKCIWALRAINNTEAHQKLNLLANNNDSIISEAALQSLNDKG